jgi:hypothetical protein
MAKELTYRYDDEEDILYAFFGQPNESIYDMVGQGIYLRLGRKPGEYIGFMILDYLKRRNSGKLPTVPHFEDLAVPPLNEIRL